MTYTPKTDWADLPSHATPLTAADLIHIEQGIADVETEALAGLTGKQTHDTDLDAIAALDPSTAGVLASDGAGWIRKSYAALLTALGITGTNTGDETTATIKSKLGITTLSGSNTGDQDLSALAPKASPALTGTPTVPTAAPGTNSTQVASTAYADAAAAAAAVGLLDYRGTYNASVNTFPASGGSGSAGAVVRGDFWVVSTPGILGGTAVSNGDLVIALVDTPGQTAASWDLIEHDVGYAPENVANKSTDGTFAANSATLYPSQSAVKTYADALVLDSIADGDATHAPSRNAVFDALALKASTASLGGAASLNVGTTVGTVAAGDDSRIVAAANASLVYNAANYR